MKGNKDYALLLLAKTRLTYSQICSLTNVSINRIGALAQNVRPKEIRDANVLSGTTPDVQEELLKLKEEMKEEFPEAAQKVFANETGLNRKVSFQYEVTTNHPVSKETLIMELERIWGEVEKLDANGIELHIKVEGV